MTTDQIKDGLPTGEGTSPTNDVADPHPATEEDYDKIPRPGGAEGTKQPDIGANTYAHDGKAPPVSQSKGSTPQRKPRA
ncbi:MAG TPA: hypothetical protein VL147_12570 [Devosia sp.]|nr:hypothetical protein [Devosia sp.]